MNPPSKLGDGVYPYPDDNIQRPAFDPCYSACAKYNNAADCCTGHHGSPSTCQPSDYSKAAKGVCPDAYSYGMAECLLMLLPSSQILSKRLRFSSATAYLLWPTNYDLSDFFPLTIDSGTVLALIFA